VATDSAAYLLWLARFRAPAPELACHSDAAREALLRAVADRFGLDLWGAVLRGAGRPQPAFPGAIISALPA